PAPFGLAARKAWRQRSPRRDRAARIRSRSGRRPRLLTAFGSRWSQSPPPRGWALRPRGGQNFVVLLTVTYVGGGTRDLLPLINNLDAAGTHGGTYTTYENGCHAPPPALGESGFDIFSGQSVTGNICWQIVGSDAAGLVL